MDCGMGDDRYSTHSPLTVEPVILELLNKLTVLVSQGLSLKKGTGFIGVTWIIIKDEDWIWWC